MIVLAIVGFLQYEVIVFATPAAYFTGKVAHTFALVLYNSSGWTSMVLIGYIQKKKQCHYVI